MSVFLIPWEITKDIERVLTKYWWGDKSENKSGIHWMNWQRMSKHKSAGGLGFRDFRDFNLALLGKQGWRFVTRPGGLASRVYKARYFPEDDFFDSKLGNNPNFIWKSIWEAKKVVMDGARWKIGDGRSVKIWRQPWLQDEANAYITYECYGLENDTVSSLMCTGSRQWDVEVIRDLFNSRDQHCILSTAIAGDSEDDCIYWGKESLGLYSVKSAYRMLQMQKGLWDSSDDQSLWKSLWRIKAPPKALNMVWRALSFCLPTKTLMYSKYVPVDLMCPVCNGGEETIMHTLVECEFAMQCWRARGRVCSFSGEVSFSEWLKAMLAQEKHEERAEIVTLCWHIWKARNDLVWNKNKSSVAGVVASTRQYLADWMSAQKNTTKALFQDIVHGDGAVSWAKPQQNVVKITVDAATFPEFSTFGIDLMARDHEGEVIEGRSEVFQGTKRPDWAEVVAIKEALSWVKVKDWKAVIIESDCLAVIQAIRSKVAMVSPFGKIILECRSLLRELNTELFFINRTANMVAHFLARASYSSPVRAFDRRSVPIELHSALLADLV